MTVDGGLRRQIHVLLSKEKIRALNLSADRVVNLLRTENQNIPLGEIDEGDRTYLVRSQGQFENLNEIRDLVVMTRGRRARLHEGHRRGQGLDRGLPLVHAHQRTPGRAAPHHQAVGHQHRGDRRRRPRRSRPHQSAGCRHAAHGARRQLGLHQSRDQLGEGARPHRRVPGDADHLPVPARPSRDVHRLHVDPDLGDRDVRAALLQRLHAQHDDVRRPGARHRHDRRRIDRRAREHVPPHGARQETACRRPSTAARKSGRRSWRRR